MRTCPIGLINKPLIKKACSNNNLIHNKITINYMNQKNPFLFVKKVHFYSLLFQRTRATGVYY